jgi:hypothetical protein
MDAVFLGVQSIEASVLPCWNGLIFDDSVRVTVNCGGDLAKVISKILLIGEVSGLAKDLEKGRSHEEIENSAADFAYDMPIPEVKSPVESEASSADPLETPTSTPMLGCKVKKGDMYCMTRAFLSLSELKCLNSSRIGKRRG